VKLAAAIVFVAGLCGLGYALHVVATRVERQDATIDVLRSESSSLRQAFHQCETKRRKK
jgi:hypothetical protein